MIKKLLIAGGFLTGGFFLIKKLLPSSNLQAVNKNLPDLISEEEGLIYGGKKCPISKETMEEQRKITEMRNKMNPLGFLMGGSTYTAPQYPFEWNDLCTQKQISDFQTSLQNVGKNFIEQAKKGLTPPLLSPQAIINLAKRFGVGAGAFDPNKDYNISCGTEMCWEWDGSRWIKN